MTPGRIRTCTVFAAAAALAGCALKPDKMTLPPPSPAPAWREGAADRSWPARDWWRSFGSAELDDLIAKAESDNDDLAAATARVREADAEARIAGAPLLPSVAVSPEAAAVRRLTSLGAERNYGAYTATLGVAYELDVWGKNRAALQAAKSSADAARYARDVVDLTIVSGVASVYIQLLDLQDQLATAQANLTTAETVLADIQTKRQTGLATDLDVVQQQTVVDILRQVPPPLQAQEAHALDALAILTGQSAETMRITGKSLKELRAPSLQSGLPSDLLLHRPDVQQAERQLAAANADITVARAQFLPSFNLNGQYGGEMMNVVSGSVGPTQIYNLAASAVQPIFQGGRLKGQLAYARAQYAELLATYIMTTRQAYSDVEDALASVSAASAQQTATLAALDKSQQALRMSREGFSAGYYDWLSVLTSQSAVFPNRIAQIQADGAYLQSMVALYRALGGGWSARPAM